MSDYLLVYDVATVDGDKRLREVARICEGYGNRVQKSVFELVLNDDQLVRLDADLKQVIHPHEDNIRIYITSGRPARTLGTQRPWSTSRGPLQW